MTSSHLDAAALFVPGNPTGARAWRSEVAAAAAGLELADAFTVGFVLRPGRWVDIDTLAHSTAQGLRDAGALRPRFAGLDALVATKAFGRDTGATVTPVRAQALAGPVPGRVVLDAAAPAVPRPGDRDAKRRWRTAIAAAWGRSDTLDEACWADVALGVAGSLFGPLEVVLDALEPVLGRDPRGRSWQEFFPNDDRIEWLRVRRDSAAAGVSLRMGPLI